MDAYYVVTWWEDGDWFQSQPIAHGQDMIRELDAHRANDKHTGIQVWQMSLVLQTESEQ